MELVNLVVDLGNGWLHGCHERRLPLLVAALENVVFLNQFVQQHEHLELVLLLDGIELQQDFDVLRESLLHVAKDFSQLLLVLERQNLVMRLREKLP